MRASLLLLLLSIPTSTAAQVVFPGDYVGEERYGDPPAVPAGARWLGLYARGDSSWVRDVEVGWDRSTVDDMSVHTYVVRPPGPVAVFLDVPGIEPGAAVTSARGAWLALGGDGLEIELGQGRYSVGVRAEDPMGCDARVVVSGGLFAQTIFDPDMETFACDEPHFDVRWAGDVDGDGRLDLLADFSLKYSGHPARLYLSSAAAPGEHVGLAVTFEP